MIEQKFWVPTVTSQFTICPVPYHLDTYRGCKYNCAYCFARDFVTFSRRNSEHTEFSYLIGNRPDLLAKWIARVVAKDYDYSKAHEVAWKERIPLKIGATADPFPPEESTLRITYDTLKVLHSYDYPVEIQTKNPRVLADYAEEFKGANWTIAVTLISTDESFVKICEPNAESVTERLNAIKRLTDMGFKVMCKIQPAIYPKILEDLPALVRAIKEAGVWAYNIEGLKVRIAMPAAEQKIMQVIGNYLGMDIRQFYKDERKKEGTLKGTDYELSPQNKEEYILLADTLAQQHNLKFFNADNHLMKVGHGCECCGTEVLRDYKLLGCDARSRFFGSEKSSIPLSQCEVNFVRRPNKGDRIHTIEEVCNRHQGLTIKTC